MLFSNSRRKILIFVSGLCAVSVNTVIAAADSASINARIVDAANGQLLRGAVVQVEGTTLQAVSDLQGAVVLTGLPAGQHALRVTYLGMPALLQRVELAAGQHATLTLTMNAHDEVVTM